MGICSNLWLNKFPYDFTPIPVHTSFLNLFWLSHIWNEGRTCWTTTQSILRLWSVLWTPLENSQPDSLFQNGMMNGLTEQPSFLIFVSFLAIKLHNQPVKGLEKRMTTFHLIDCYSQRQQGHNRQARLARAIPLSLSLSPTTTWKSRSCDRISRCGQGTWVHFNRQKMPLLLLSSRENCGDRASYFFHLIYYK